MNRSPAIYDPSTRQELESKQDRILVVQRLPGIAKEGAQVVLGDDVYLFRSGRWHSPTKLLRDRIAMLETGNEERERVTEGATERIVEDAIERERQRQEDNLIAAIAFQQSNSIDTGDTIESDPDYRPLSSLEKSILNFVFEHMFCDTIPFDLNDMRIAYPDYATSESFYPGKRFSGLYIDPSHDTGLAYPSIQISTRYHRYASDIDASSTVNNTDILKSPNIDMFRTFVHEATHRWQFNYSLYGNRNLDGLYDFTAEDLKNPENMGLEQVASAVGTWFVILWQLENTPNETDINLTNDAYWNATLSTRFDKITEIPHVDTDLSFDDGNVILNIPQRIVTEAEAMELLEYFEPLRMWLCIPRSPSRTRDIRTFIIPN